MKICKIKFIEKLIVKNDRQKCGKNALKKENFYNKKYIK